MTESIHPGSTTNPWNQEIEKWDSYYASLDLTIETDETRSFGYELLEKLAAFLPDGAHTLEAGCGGGWQSLVLARSGKYQVSMLDFSYEALKYANRVFELAGLKANTLYGNMVTPGAPEFDLVFNAGVFEHYTFEEQVDLLRGMASRSRQFVMVIVPNQLCYWYWIWRINAVSKGLWTFGKEVPFVDLSKLFEAAGLHYIGQSFMAANWTESFIELIPGINDELRQLILKSHRQPLIDPYQKSYLVAGLGCVTDSDCIQVPGWDSSPIHEDFANAELQAIIADMLSTKIRSEEEAKQRISELVEQLDQTHAQAALYQYQLENIQNSRIWALSQTLWKIRQNTIPSGSNRAASVRKIYERFKLFLRASGILSLRRTIRRNLTDFRNGRRPALTAHAADENGFWASYQNKKATYTNWLSDLRHLNPVEVEQINKLIHLKPYKGIVVYPHAVHWEPVQRPHQLLMEFGRQGYLCFFCEAEGPALALEEKADNVFVIHGEKHLLYPLQNFHVLVLCTWMYQMPFIEALPNRCLWYDLIDKIEIFSLYDQDMQHLHAQVVKQADLVTYSGLKLREFVEARKDAVYLPNGVRVSDFTGADQLEVAPRMAKVLSKSKPVIGYYGALAEWVDQSIIRALADGHPEWEFVIIGKAWLDISVLENVSNIHYFGPVPYSELSSYAARFDVGIIPFAVNELTDCVSPIKLFEYCALGFPIVATPFFEITQYQERFIHFAENVDEFSRAISECLDEEIRAIARVAGPVFAEKNQWSNRVADVERMMIQSWAGLKSYANYTPYRHLAVMTETFFHYDGQGFYSGGAERYLIDLADLVSRMNVKMVVYQYGVFPWIRKYKEMDVISLALTNQPMERLTRQSIIDYNKNFYITNISKATLNIFSPFSDNWPAALRPSIGISHGISWDNFYANYDNGIRFWDSNRGAIEASRNCDLVVSVDTNTANWFQTIDFEIGQKIRYIPNYVDLELFHLSETAEGRQDKVIILYPRRLYRARGLYLLLAIMDEILVKYPQVEFHFVGRGFIEDTRHVEVKQQIWGSRVQWYSLSPDQMPQAYQNADIALIPTLYSEGTSLSCLEAMACGNAVIATRIGGLTDLVINNYNGLLIEPDEQALKIAIMDLLDNPEKLALLKKNGLEVAKAFSKRNWEEKWRKVLEQKIDVEQDQVAFQNRRSRTKLVEIYCEDTPIEHLRLLVTMLLQRGDLIYLRVKENDRRLIETSFHRLQFLNWQETIETSPDLVIADSGAGPRLKRVDYVLSNNLDRDLSSILSHM